ncbi:DNA gyrase inhibitor YacG [Prosthecomicrobium sp. N25]|uniref:DNA gyrase inhibitor YacG n=1 Tax=Prosthecomicrobium sp. N25 TaxID=3129254 RepID=UPI003FCC8630
MTDPVVPKTRKARPCPICSRMSLAATYPFCSDRCRKVDLHRWLSGAYAIPAVESDDPDEEDTRS